MTDTQQISDAIRNLCSNNFRIVCCFVGVTIILLAFLACYKKHQREILWGGGIAMIVSAMVLAGFGILDVYNYQDLFIFLMLVACSVVFAYYAEVFHKKQQKNIKDIEAKTDNKSDGDNTVDAAVKESTSSDITDFTNPDEVVLPESLDNALARKVFERAIGKGLIKIENGHYVWLGKSKALLAYMCGRIYCSDYTEYLRKEHKNIWRQGELRFPESALNKLFQEESLAQSRKSRELLTSPEGFNTIDSLFAK